MYGRFIRAFLFLDELVPQALMLQPFTHGQGIDVPYSHHWGTPRYDIILTKNKNKIK